MSFCLPPKDADEFKRQILSGEIDPLKLAEMTSAERHAFFARRFGELTAGPMNALLESKLLLKNQQAGMVNWAQRMMGSNQKAKVDIVSKVKRIEKLLSPEEEDKFLSELVAQKFGTRVSYEEAQKIAELSAKVTEEKERMAAGGDRMNYGRAVVALSNYVGGLVREANAPHLSDFKKDPIGAAGMAIKVVASNSKAIKASMDNSALLRQGWKTLLTHPGIWQKNARQSFVDLVKAFGSDTVMDEVNADIVSRPTYDLMRQAGLAVGVHEEAYPTSLPEHIPVLGRAYRASEHAYTAFVQRTRADVFDKYLEISKRSDVELTQQRLQSIGKLANSLTGRGNLGFLEPIADTLNSLFFSPRMMKANFDTLTAHLFDRDMDSFAKKQAVYNITKIIIGTAAILAIARAVSHRGVVEPDARSANSGKIRVGNTRYDMTAGMSGMVTLAARLLTMSSKSSITGKVNPINSGKFGATTGSDLVYNFFENKLSPAASVVKDIIKGKTFDGKKPTVGNELVNLFVPLPATNALELKNDRKTTTANMIVAMMADALGISTNTYDSNKRP